MSHSTKSAWNAIFENIWRHKHILCSCRKLSWVLFFHVVLRCISQALAKAAKSICQWIDFVPLEEFEGFKSTSYIYIHMVWIMNQERPPIDYWIRTHNVMIAWSHMIHVNRKGSERFSWQFGRLIGLMQGPKAMKSTDSTDLDLDVLDNALKFSKILKKAALNNNKISSANSNQDGLCHRSLPSTDLPERLLAELP